MGVVSVLRYLFWDVQHQDQPPYTIAYVQRMQKPHCQTQTVQNIPEIGLPACSQHALRQSIKNPSGISLEVSSCPE